jgi:hypothetical protein
MAILMAGAPGHSPQPEEMSMIYRSMVFAREDNPG